MVRESKRKIVFKTETNPYSRDYELEHMCWQKKMFDSGFTVPLAKIIDRLGVSRYWVFNNLNSSVSFVQYTAKFMKKRGLEYSFEPNYNYIYYNEAEFHSWLMNNSEFTVQTNICDMPKTAERNSIGWSYIKGIKINAKSKRDVAAPNNPDVMNYINLAKACPFDIACDKKRKFFNPQPYEAFDWWDDEVIFFNAAQAKSEHKNYIRFVREIAPDSVDEKERIYSSRLNIIGQGGPNGQTYNFKITNDEGVARLAFRLSLIKIHLKIKDRGKVYYCYRPEYRDLSRRNYSIPVLVSASHIKHPEYIRYFADCIAFNDILDQSKYMIDSK